MAGPLNITGLPPRSNVMLLPQLGGMTFSITTTGGWYDAIPFFDPATGLPLDLSGITFHAELRRTVSDAQNVLDLSSATSPATLINGKTSGVLYFSADATLFTNMKPGIYMMDILATDDLSVMVRNLCEQAPIAVTVNQGVTR